MKKALFPGTFDPPTNGHMWVLAQGLDLFDEIHIGIGVNPAKQPLFSIAERLKLWDAVIESEFENRRARITVGHYSDEFTVNYALNHQCEFILRGLRTVQDYHDECSLQQINRDIEPTIKPVYLMSPHEMGEQQIAKETT